MTSLVKKLTIFITTFIFLLFGLFFTVHANQALAHTLSGNVSDSSGVDISGATVDVIDISTSNNVGSTITDGSGNYNLSVNSGTYNVQVSPPSGSGFGSAVASNYTISSDTIINFILVPTGSVVLSGHVYGPLGNPIPNQLVYLHSTVTHTDVASIRTDNSGAYLLSASPGTYILNIQGSGNDPSLLNVPSDYNLEVPNYSLTQSVVADIYVPTKQVTVHVQDSSNNPIDNVQVSTSNAGINGISIGNGLDNANARSRGSGQTDSSGNTTLWLVPSSSIDPYIFTATPPSGTNFTTTTIPNIIITNDTQETITLQSSVVLSGHVYGPLGNPIPNQLVYLHSTVTHTDVASIRTDNSGAYLLSASPGTYILNIQGSGNDPSLLNVPSDYNLEVPNYSLTQSVVADIYVPTKQVTVHVQDSSNNPIDNVQVSTSNAGINGISIGNGLDNANARSRGSGQTDSSGNTTLWLVPSSSIDPYIFTATPPNGSIYLSFVLSNILVSSDQTEIISLQLIHDAPVTTATLSPNPNPQNEYEDPTTVTLTATAAEGFTIANTYYTIDGGAQQTYSSPFEVSGEGEHTITFWSIDNVGVFEELNEQTFIINATPQFTSLSPANIWIGLKNSDDVGTRFDLKAEVYKNGTELVSSGQLDNVWGGSSGFNNANLQTIPFNTFTPVDFPQGSTLSIKLYVRNACVGPTHNSGIARLWYDDAAANSRFDATVEGSSSNYYLRDIFALSTTVGSGPKKKIDVQAGAKCSPFKEFGTWTIIP